MNTPAHLMFGAAAFGRDRPTTLAALFGALLPDLSLYLMASWALFVKHIPERVVFGELYFSDNWQRVFAIDNSVILWGTALGLGVAVKARVLIAFAGAGLLHIFADFLLHHDDGRQHFWPVSTWVFESPVSYWDSRHHAGWIGPVISILSLLFTLVLWRRLPHWGWRLTFGLLLAAELYTLRGWFLHF
ncbi:cobalamin biosynthesis protein CobQ [Aliiroseovarius sp. Z3]|uniref:cobalamin biosynthesis protein CobQ n=1 Tax=Aliiroseovarius sp. Z3 TaxID=2811402 RepID=UPI0023B240D6|nr:cobalamin biosynthesis protein CobQ [Aliiroseovarius sp. Z3]MDE9450768.1 cobalamin biosynthesis protein CobQ [Aliiroseovarius sp. Z3]